MTPGDGCNEVALLVTGAASPARPPGSRFNSRFVFTPARFHQGTIVSRRAFVMKASVVPPILQREAFCFRLHRLPLNCLPLFPPPVSLSLCLFAGFFSNCFFVASLCLGISCLLCFLLNQTHETTAPRINRRRSQPRFESNGRQTLLGEVTSEVGKFWSGSGYSTRTAGPDSPA